MLSSDMIVQRARWHVAALQVKRSLLRLGLALRAYNPNQPRVPAGNPDGGQWTEGEGGTLTGPSDDARIIRIGTQDERKYTVDLAEEESRGGHTIRHHVGKTDYEMRQRVQENTYRTRFFTSGLRRSGSFPSMESAADLTNRTLEQNSDVVDQVAAGALDAAFVKRRLGYVTGREAYSTEDGVLYVRDNYGVGVCILHDRRSPRGYRVYTSYPRNDGD